MKFFTGLVGSGLVAPEPVPMSIDIRRETSLEIIRRSYSSTYSQELLSFVNTKNGGCGNVWNLNASNAKPNAQDF